MSQSNLGLVISPGAYHQPFTHCTGDGELIGVIDARSLMSYFPSTAGSDVNQETINHHQKPQSPEQSFSNNELQISKKPELSRFFEIASIQCIVSFTGYFVQTNTTFSKVLGFTPEEFLAEPLINFVHPEDRATTIAELEKLTRGEATLAFENRYRTKDGDYRWLLWTAKPYVSEQLVYAAARDITERKNHELAVIKDISDRQQTAIQLQQERDFSEAVINTVGALITVLDRQGAIVSFNRTCEQVTGYSFEEVKGQQFWDFLILTQEKKDSASRL
ncbi:MAG: PAS domain S-box protein [Hydrococcus sp. SU_1_0]|nr:PAS domain S-box protein [Hydrococcus sp. SU_1_0]